MECLFSVRVSEGKASTQDLESLHDIRFFSDSHECQHDLGKLILKGPDPSELPGSMKLKLPKKMNIFPLDQANVRLLLEHRWLWDPTCSVSLDDTRQVPCLPLITANKGTIDATICLPSPGLLVMWRMSQVALMSNSGAVARGRHKYKTHV